MDGILLYDKARGRFIVQELIDHTITEDSRTVDLHCGDSIRIMVRMDEWLDTRIEKNSDDDVLGWYFVKVGRASGLIGHRVKV